MPAVSVDRLLLEKKILGETFIAEIKSTRNQLRTGQQRTVTHINRSLDVLQENGYHGPVRELFNQYDGTVSNWEEIKTIIRELGEFIKEEKQTLNDKLRVLHNANKIFKHAEKNSDLVLRRSQRIRDLISLRTSIKRNELI
jgi:hypothetical protein